MIVLQFLKRFIKAILLLVEMLERAEKDKEAHTQIPPKFTGRDNRLWCVFQPIGKDLFFL